MTRAVRLKKVLETRCNARLTCSVHVYTPNMQEKKRQRSEIGLGVGGGLVRG